MSSRKLTRLASSVRDANSIGKDFGEAKKSRSRGIRTWRAATRRNKVLEGINNLRRFLFFRPPRTWQNGGSGERGINQEEKCLRVLLRAHLDPSRPSFLLASQLIKSV